MVKCVIITSQYYHTRFSFICEFNPETFKQQAISLIEELEKYKRREEDDRPFYYGDFDEKYFESDRKQYNVNDTGDLYFEIVNSIYYALRVCQKYWEDNKRDSRGYKSKEIITKTSNHHDEFIITQILKKHFQEL